MRAQLHRLDRRLHRTLCGHHDGRHAHAAFRHGLHQTDAVKDGHAQVGQYDVDIRLLQHRHGVLTIGCGVHLMAELAQHDFKHAAHMRFVVDDEDAGGRHVELS